MRLDVSTKNGYTGAGQTIAIVDTGVDTRHPYFGGRVVAEGCFSSADEKSTAGYCPNGRWSQIGAGTGMPCTFSAECYHGTHVAGIAAGRYGVAPAAKVIALKVFHPTDTCGMFEAAPCARADNWDILAALRHVYSLRNTYRIAAVNMSIGGGAYDGFCDAEDSYTTAIAAVVANLSSAGVATVVASGNDGLIDGLGFPACLSRVVPVGNTTLDYAGTEALNSSSNTSDHVLLLAPGTAICSAYPSLFPADTNTCDTSTTAGTSTGTSMASPQVAGAIAVLRQLRPTAPVNDVLHALWYSGTPIADDTGRTRPRIDVWGALVWLYNH